MDTTFEAELTALSEAIAAEEMAEGVTSATESAVDRERLHLALKEKMGELLPSGTPTDTTDDTTQVPPPTHTTSVSKGAVGTKSYLDDVDDATVAKVNEYVALVFSHGIQATLREVINQDPFLLDVFHDALTDKLYGELKNRGLLK